MDSGESSFMLKLSNYFIIYLIKCVSFSGFTAIFQLKEITLGNIYGTALFLWAFYHQYKAAVLLANLRKDKKGSVVTHEHRVPQGDWFELVSSPHNLAEILMYLALTFILLGSSTWPVVFLWVLSNQVSHKLM